MPEAVSEPLKIVEWVEQGFFAKSSLPKRFQQPGVFMQQGRIVGYTFGSLAEGGFLWKGAPGSELQSDFRVHDFYRITFADGREEQLILALAIDDDVPNIERLAALAAAFRFDPKLSDADTPSRLRPDAVAEYTRGLIAELGVDGLQEEILNIFDAQILANIGSPALLMDVIETAAATAGFSYAVHLLEMVLEQMSGAPIPTLNTLHLQLYHHWIAESLGRGDLQAAWQAHAFAGQYFSGDPEIHLFGVEIALVEGNWAEAERLYHLRDYPPSLRNKAERLRARILELRGQEGKIVIRFAPGAKQIPVNATLGEGVPQQFILDTGATQVTIPYTTAERLGFRRDGGDSRRGVITAGGITYASEIVIPSIQLGGWVVYDVKALVLDIPNQPGVGLLGLDYLRRFRVDINSEQGTLTLVPR
jgi:clan AA aspartic protease (TIGR02281 family)